ncbi:transcriptional regulator domain-containing protein [Aquamicrobium terrae]|uniref:transcriptional regulator domain-containing protein n=1 Tax=Aquamicrobium terrae TaxID=1324945 RepID=UPI003391ED59
MSEDDNWRSDAAYSYVDELTPDDLAWEFLRRNPDYRKSYAELVATGRLNEEEASRFARHWGLRFRRGPDGHGARSADLLDPGKKSDRRPAQTRAGPARRLPHNNG